MPAQISRASYAQMFGPTVGDKVRLADTELFIEVEKDFTHLWRGGEVRRRQGDPRRHGPEPGDARARAPSTPSSPTRWSSTPTGIYKADIGLKDGRIAAIGKAGNPDTQPGVTIIIGPGTEIIAGEGKILTAGGFDAHIHFICPQQIEEALMSGITTMLGGGTGPAHGTLATTCTPGPWHMARMIQSFDAFPMNIGLSAKGNASLPAALEEMVLGGACALKLHEDWGTTPGGHRLLPVGRRRLRRAGDDPHRYAERDRLRRKHRRRLQGPHHPRLPHRGRRRRPCARHHQGLRPAQRHPVLDQSDAALHGQHHRRASRHADGLPPSVAVDPRGHRLRRKPHPQGDHRGRRHPARHRRLLDHLVRQPGHGPRRRGGHPHLADRRQDEAPARPRCRRKPATTTISASAATSPNTPSTRPSRTACRRRSARSRSASAPIWCCGTRPSSASSRTWCCSAA